MQKRLNELERILEMPNKELRKIELRNLAAKLGMIPPHMEGKNISEQRLVIAIYDGFVRQEKQARKNLRALILLFGSAILISLVLSIIPRSVIQYARFLEAKRNTDISKKYEGMTANGEVVRDEKNQPVLFEAMDGLYDKYYNDGTLHFTYRYSKGQLKEQFEFNRKGDLISHISYDENGNPVLRSVK